MRRTKIPPSNQKERKIDTWKRIEPCIYLRGEIYYIDFRAHGKRQREAIGTSLQLARIVLMKRKVQAREDKFFDPRQERKTTFDDAAKDFLVRCKNVNKPSSLERNEYLSVQLAKTFGGMRLVDINVGLIEEYRNKRLTRDKVSPATVNREMSSLKAIINHAIRNDKASRNPVTKIQRLKEAEPRNRYLTLEEIQRLLDACPEHFKPIVEIALLTGMRKGEILGLKKREIDFNREVIVLENTKSRKRREIPISGRLKAILEKCYNTSKSEFVFMSRLGEPYQSVHSLFDLCVERAGLAGDVWFHDLRHTFASHLAMSGVDLGTIKDLLGHSTIHMTMRYAHLSQSHKREAVEKLSGIVPQILPQGPVVEESK